MLLHKKLGIFKVLYLNQKIFTFFLNFCPIFKEGLTFQVLSHITFGVMAEIWKVKV
jgi:hypothetical protein